MWETFSNTSLHKVLYPLILLLSGANWVPGAGKQHEASAHLEDHLGKDEILPCAQNFSLAWGPCYTKEAV